MLSNVLSAIQQSLLKTGRCIFRHCCFVLFVLSAVVFASQTDNQSGITFKVCELEPKYNDNNRFSYDTLIMSKFGEVEAAADIRDTFANDLKSSINGFIEAGYHAYISHRPLILSPDMIWLLIIQGFSIHVNQNQDSLREYFVDFGGKKNLRVIRTDFIKRGQNPWEEVFDEFSMLIGASVKGPVREIITTGYSTTTSIEKSAFQISMMDAMSGYFSYTLDFYCGIPSFTLEGTVDDWVSLRERAVHLREYKLEWWIDSLLPVLNKFVDASRGKIDKKFWNSFFTVEDGCNDIISGWVTRFFPYFVEGNGDFIRNTRFRFEETPMFPNGLSRAGFVWITKKKTYDMELISGFAGFRFVGDSRAVRPVISWVVREIPKETCFDRIIKNMYSVSEQLPDFLLHHSLLICWYTEYFLRKCNLIKQDCVFNNETTVRGKRLF